MFSKKLLGFVLISYGYAYTFVQTGFDPSNGVIFEYGSIPSHVECAVECLGDILCCGFRYSELNDSRCQGIPASMSMLNATESVGYNQPSFYVFQYHSGPDCSSRPYGVCTGDTPFNFFGTVEHGPITSITISWHIWITGLTIQYSDGNTDSVLHGLPTHTKTFNIPDGEIITNIIVHYKTKVDRIFVYTNEGTNSGRLGGVYGKDVDHIRGFGLQGIKGEGSPNGIQCLSFAFEQCP